MCCEEIPLLCIHAFTIFFLSIYTAAPSRKDYVQDGPHDLSAITVLSVFLSTTFNLEKLVRLSRQIYNGKVYGPKCPATYILYGSSVGSWVSLEPEVELSNSQDYC